MNKEELKKYEDRLAPCGYQRFTYECRGDGYIWDADYDGFDPEDLSWPCPCCNTEVYLRKAKDEAESVVEWMDPSGSGTGLDIWVCSKAIALAWNKEAAELALSAIGTVTPLTPETEEQLECSS